LSAAADAEPGYSVTISSDDRFRGQSTSDQRPVATGTISYDDARGLYGGVSLTAGPTRSEGLRLLRSVQYVGYAHRLGSGIGLDAGISHRVYSRQATVEYARRFIQYYAGVVGRRWSSRVFFSPNYDGQARSATYAELDALLLSRGDWSLTSHIGVLAPPADAGRPPRRVEVDWRLGVSRRLGRLGLSVTTVGGGPDDEDRQFRGSVVFAATRAF
jgi:uncharacterized protein (TIGR02001 family)